MELGRSLGDPAVGPVGLQAQPKAFNGIEVGRSGWQINRLEVMPVEPLDLVPGGVVNHQQGAATGHGSVLLGQGVEEGLERLAITVVEEHGAESPILRACGSKHIVADVLAQIREVRMLPISVHWRSGRGSPSMPLSSLSLKA